MSSSKKWTQREENYAVRNYHKLTAKQIGQKLGRSVSSVNWKLNTLGVTKESAIATAQLEEQTAKEVARRTIYQIDPVPVPPRKNWFQRLFNR